MIHLISIIVPVFNNENYLCECINSIISQTYKNWELILVDDGSTDSSKKICDHYANNDNRINVIHKNNSGVSDSRNKGLDISHGDYVIFLDSDDYWCDSTILEKMITLAEEYNLDIVRGGYKEVDEHNNVLYVSNKSYKISNKVVNSLFFLENIISGEYFLWLCLIKKDRIGNIRFNKNHKYLEDVEFYLNILMNDLRCMALSEIFYTYRKQSNSVTMNFNPNFWGDILDIVRLCFKLSDNTLDKNMKSFLLNEGIKFFFSNTNYISRYPLSINEILIELHRYGVNDLYYEVKMRIKYTHISNKYIEKYLSYKYLLKYYRYKYFFKSYVRKIIKK